jgi:outer membrane protein OmpA-like peptidoglycan-associated protein
MLLPLHPLYWQFVGRFSKLPLALRKIVNVVTNFLNMHSLLGKLIFLALFIAITNASFAQQQDKEQSKLYMQQAELIMADTKAMDDARDLMVMAADFDTTNIKANFEAGNMHILTINKDRAAKFFLRVFHQKPNFRFDIEYWIGYGFQFGLQFNNAIRYYTLYKDKLAKQPEARENVVELKEVERRLVECQNGIEFVAHPNNYSIVNMGREVNSEFDDYAPVLTEDENEIIFTTKRREGNSNENVSEDNKPFEDVFFSRKSGGKWSNAKNIGETINSKFNNSDLALSPDGKTLFLYKDVNAGDIYFSKRQPDGSWGIPEPLPGIINSTFKESSVSMTKDGTTLYFASDRPGGIGGSDIYVCSKDATGAWTLVKNLGATINSDLDEEAPFISQDSKTMYFSSRGKKGMGGYDIFKSTLLDAAKNQWSEPVNLGYPINTPDDDVFYVSSKDGARGYYSSVRDDGFGYADIYVITIAETPKKEPAKVALQPLVYVVSVVDADSQSPLDAKVKLQGLKDNVVVGSVNKGGGVFEFSVTSETAKDYRLSVERDGYAFVDQQVSVAGASSEAKKIAKTIALKKLVVGTRSVLRNIYFDFDKASFKAESYAELNKLEGMMKQNGNIKVEIAGHTDVIGTREFNKQLSQRRANAVRSFLMSKGIDPRRVTAVGYGREKPLASNDDEKEGRELNRRVEFKVLDN